MENLLTPAEEQLIDGAKALFYYPETETIDLGIKRLLSGIIPDHRKLFIASILTELNQEQLQRQNYIIASLGLRNITKDQTDTIIIALANDENLTLAQALSELVPGHVTTIGSIPPETKEQILIYAAVASQIKSYIISVIKNDWLSALYEKLKRAGKSEKEKFLADMDAFTERLDKELAGTILTNVATPASILQDVAQLGIEQIFDNKISLAEQLDMLTKIQLILNAQKANSEAAAPVDEQALINEIALWEYYNDPPQFLEVD